MDYLKMLKRVIKAQKAHTKAIDDLVLKEPAMAEAIRQREREMEELDIEALGERMSDEEVNNIVNIQLERGPYRMALERTRKRLDEVIANG